MSKKNGSNGRRFFLSIGEWTSRKNKKYRSVSLHMNESKVISFRMKRIDGSIKAEDAVMMIAEKLLEFGLNLKEPHC